MQLKIEEMINTLKILSLLMLTFSCSAQNQIFDIAQDRGTNRDPGVYFKDTNNLLNLFEGTYVYTHNNILLKIVLQKKIQSFALNKYYEDLLIGEYQFIENGIEKVNTLSKLNINYSDKSNHSIDGNLIITAGNTGCFDCVPNEKAWKGGLVDSSTGNTAELIIRRVTVNGAPAIKIWIMWRMRYKNAIDSALPNPSFEGGYYTLMKQL